MTVRAATLLRLGNSRTTDLVRGARIHEFLSGMALRLAACALVSTSLFAAEFENGQAARAVLGQSSFSSREAGIRATSMVVSQHRLYAADSFGHILTFDLSRLGSVRDDRSARQSRGCAVCLPSPSAETNESVMPGVAAVSVWDKTIAVADGANHRVLIWRDSTAPRPDRGPDIILGRLSESSAPGPATLVNPVSVALDGKRIYVGDAALHRVLVWNSLPSTDDQPADVVLGQPDFTSNMAVDVPDPESIAAPSAMVSDGNNLFVADSARRRILVFSPGDLAMSPDAAVNSASLVSGPVAPGTLITIRGNHFSEVNESISSESGEPLPKRLGGVEVIFDGLALPLLAVAPTEVQAQIPYDLGNRSAASLYLRLEHSASAPAVTTPVVMRLVPASPGLFALGGSEPRSAILLHAAALSTGGAPPVTEESPASPGEVLTVWATGLGAVWDDGGSYPLAGHPQGTDAEIAVPVMAQIDGLAATVLSAKLPEGSIGVYEIQIVMPAEAIANTEGQLTLTQNGMVSNAVSFPTQPGRP